MADYTTQKDKVKEYTEKLEQGIIDFFQSGNFEEYLNVMSRFPHYSMANTVLIAMQKPDATLVAGYDAWQKKFKRHVMKGEKGIRIFAPVMSKKKYERNKIDPETLKPVLNEKGEPIKEEVERSDLHFRVVSVYDVSQTDGEPLPELKVDQLTGDVKDFDIYIDAIKKTSTVPVTFENITSGANGYYSVSGKYIAIKEGMSQAQTLKTAIHELAHSVLHDVDLTVKRSEQKDQKDRSTKEVEAESVAYVVCRHLGIDSGDYSFGYVASWSSGMELPELKSSLQTIRDTSSQLIEKITNSIEDIQQERAAKENEWQFYIIPDLKTWAIPADEKPRTELERFSSLDEAMTRFEALRLETTNFQQDMNEDNGLPYAHLTLGIENEHGAADLLQVRAGKQVLVDDFSRLDSMKDNAAVHSALQAISDRVGFDQVITLHTMSDEEIQQFTYDHFKDRLDSMQMENPERYLQDFDEMYENGQMDDLKPTINQQSKSEIIPFDQWNDSIFEVKDSLQRVELAIACFRQEYDAPNGGGEVVALTEDSAVFLKEWLSSVVQEGNEYSKLAADLIDRIDTVLTKPEAQQEETLEDALSAKQQSPAEAVYEISGKLLHLQENSAGDWEYIVYSRNFAVLENGQLDGAELSITQARDEVMALHSIEARDPITIISVAELNKRLNDHEAGLRSPVYTKTFAEAKKLGETDLWRTSANATLSCARQFDAEYGNAYHNFAVTEFLENMVERYGMERCKIVLASTIQLADWDARYHQPNKDAAALVNIPGASNDAHDSRRQIAIRCHPCAVDVAFSELRNIEKAQTVEQSIAPKQPTKKKAPLQKSAAAPKKPSIMAKLRLNQQKIAEGKDAKDEKKHENQR